MPISKEQADKLKKQLLSQIDQMPNENKEQIKQHVLSLDEAGFEEFLKQQGIPIPRDESSPSEPQQNKCIFCSISKNEVPSYKIAENKKAIAILEINPLSKGHAMVIPFDHTPVEKISKAALGLAKEVTKKIKSKFKPEDIKIETSSFMNHAVINIIPMYKNIPLEKKNIEEKELKALQSKLETKRRAPRKKSIKKPSSGLPKISFRIP